MSPGINAGLTAQNRRKTRRLNTDGDLAEGRCPRFIVE